MPICALEIGIQMVKVSCYIPPVIQTCFPQPVHHLYVNTYVCPQSMYRIVLLFIYISVRLQTLFIQLVFFHIIFKTMFLKSPLVSNVSVPKIERSLWF